MYLDAAATNSAGTFNRKFAHMVGLNPAVYWSALMDVLLQVSKKKTYDTNGFFTLNRTYMEEVTTLSKDQQYECDEVLKSVGILKVDSENKNKLFCDIKQFFAIIVDDKKTDMTTIKVLANKSTKESKKESKRVGIINRLLSRVTDKDPEVQRAYAGFLDSVYEKGFLKNAQIDIFQDTLDKYTTDSKVKLDILKIATTKRYLLCEWSIGIYEKDHKPGTHLAEQKVVTEVREDLSFE